MRWTGVHPATCLWSFLCDRSNFYDRHLPTAVTAADEGGLDAVSLDAVARGDYVCLSFA